MQPVYGGGACGFFEGIPGGSDGRRNAVFISPATMDWFQHAFS